MDQVIIQSPPTTHEAPAGHNEAMIAKVDANQAKVDAATNPRPDWLPEKFASVEDLAKAYGELEAKQGGAKPGPEATPPVTPPVDTPSQSEADAAVAKAGLDTAALRSEFTAEGKLSDASIAKLEAAGFDKATIDGYIAGQQALVAQYDTAVMAETPGGSDKYGEMVEWAKANLTDADIAAYNAAVSSGDLAQAKLAVAGLGAKFASAVGNEPTLIGGLPGTGPVDVFESRAQVTAAMKDPRYGKDPAFRAAVQAKLGRSQVF